MFDVADPEFRTYIYRKCMIQDKSGFELQKSGQRENCVCRIQDNETMKQK